MNKKVLLLVAFVALTTCIFGQQTKAIELIWKGKYDNASKLIDKALVKNNNDIEFNFYKAYLLFQRNYEGYNLVDAYKYIQNADIEYLNVDAKTKEKLDLIPINREKLTAYLDTICRFALEDAITAGTYEAYQNYIMFFRDAPEQYRNEAKMYRNSEAYKLALAEDTEEAYSSFLDSYPNASQAPDAERRRNEKAYERVKKDNTLAAYEDFIKRYPKAVQVDDAQNNIYKLALDAAVKKGKSSAIKAYMEKYPKSNLLFEARMQYEEKLYQEETASGDCKAYFNFAKRYPDSKWKNMALNEAAQCASDANDIELIKYCYTNLPSEKKRTALKAYYNILASDGELITLTTFYEELPDDQKALIRDKYVQDSAVAAMGEKLKIYNGYSAKKQAQYDEYIKAAAPKEKAFVALQKMIETEIANQNYTSALVIISKYAPYWNSNPKKINDLKEILSANNLGIQKQAFSDKINTAGNEYNPVISSDGKTMYFCGANRADNIKGEDIFVSEKIDNEWSQASIVSQISGNQNDYPECISSNGSVLYIFRNGKIYFSKKAGANWAKPQRMSSNINSCIWQGDAFLSADGKALFFAAKRKDMLNVFNDSDFDGLTYHGKTDELQTDIYVCTIDEESGQWSKPMNIGSTINTMYTERTPFLDAEMKHLYFASDGHGGLGGLDMFVSTRLKDDCWDCWSEPINLGKEINTQDDDMSLKISNDGTEAYISLLNGQKGKKGNYDIYYFALPESLQPKNIK